MRWALQGTVSAVKNHVFFTELAYSLRMRPYFTPQILPLFL